MVQVLLPDQRPTDILDQVNVIEIQEKRFQQLDLLLKTKAGNDRGRAVVLQRVERVRAMMNLMDLHLQILRLVCQLDFPGLVPIAKNSR